MHTYWLYAGNTPLATVRMPEGASVKEVKERALRQHHTIPLRFPEQPFFFHQKISEPKVQVLDTAELNETIQPNDWCDPRR